MNEWIDTENQNVKVYVGTRSGYGPDRSCEAKDCTLPSPLGN